MIALVAIFLFTLMGCAIAVWLFRKASGWHGFTAAVVGRPRSAAKTKIGLQHGFVQLAAKHKAQMTAKSKGQKPLIRHRAPQGDFQAPWGW